MGLQVNTKKTRITHTLTPINGNVGFDFLGCHFLQVRRSPKRSGKNTMGQPLGFKTLIRPSKEKMKSHIRELNKKIRSLRGAPQEALISALNPMIRGWARYYRTVESTRTFCGCDGALYYQLMSWATWRHSKKRKNWVTKKYWRRVGDRLAFAVSDTNCLTLHSRTTIIRPYRKVKGNASPYNGDLLYWSQRLKQHPLTRTTLGRLLHKQQGKCRWCELAFRDGDRIEIDHLDRNRANHALSNQIALHLHCHDERHAKFQKEWTPATGINHR
jgi:RNA-directed DNA polymerase